MLCALLPVSFGAGFREKDMWGLPDGQTAPHSPLPCQKIQCLSTQGFNFTFKVEWSGEKSTAGGQKAGEESSVAKIWEKRH